jgi:polyferredoxin
MLVFHFLTGALFLVGVAKFGGRFFCKLLCPIGAVLGLFNKIAIYKVDVNNNKCTGCMACKKVCPMDISILNKSFLSRSNCISCGRCIKVCPTKKIEYSINLNDSIKNKFITNPIMQKKKIKNKKFNILKN